MLILVLPAATPREELYRNHAVKLKKTERQLKRPYLSSESLVHHL
jgi:hypothetical protein